MHGPATCTLRSGGALECGVGPALSVHSLWGSQEQHQQGGHLQISLTSRDVRRWTLAVQASRRAGEELYHDSPKPSVNYFTYYAHGIFHEHGQKLLLKSFFSREPGIMPLLYRLAVIIGVLNIPFWILSRMYIIVESFISLRHVERGVYQTVEWTDYIPHL